MSQFDPLKDQHFISTEELCVFEFDSPGQTVDITDEGFISLCPFHGHTLLFTLNVVYRPTAKQCIELGSLRTYLQSFRDVGIGPEECTRRIRIDLEKLLECVVYVKTLHQNHFGFLVACEEGCVYVQNKIQELGKV